MKKKYKGTENLDLNYNDRMDGYGFGPPENMNDELPYEKERKRIPYPEMPRDEHGLRNQYGPVDQYVFRDKYSRRWSKPDMRDTGVDWRDWDRDLNRYGNDDHPGGHERIGKQRGFIGKGPKGYKRSDERIYEDVCETLMRHHEIDASEIGVKVTEGVVVLEGLTQNRREKKMAEMIIEDLPGVEDVRNELRSTKHLL